MNFEEISNNELNLNIGKVDFSTSNDELRLGIFKAIANEEGLLLNINKILAKKLQFDFNSNISSSLVYKKLLDLYHNPSEWVKHFECLKKDKECLFKNVAFNTYNGNQIYLSVYLILSQPFVYGIFRDLDIDIKEIDLNGMKTRAKENDIMVIDLDKPSIIFQENSNYKENQVSETNLDLQNQKKESTKELQNQSDIEIIKVNQILENKEQESIITDETFFNAPFGIIVLKNDKRNVFYNNKLKEIFDIKEDNLGYYSLFVKYIFPAIESWENGSENDMEDLFRSFINGLTEDKPLFFKVSLTKNNNLQYNIYSVFIKVNRNLNAYQRIFYVFEIQKEVQSKEESEQSKTFSLQDPLTNINNRISFDNIFPNTVELAKRYKKPLSLIIFDVDNLKKINDTFGYDKGDEILRNLASLVKLNIRKSDIFIRYGGGKFIILCPETNLPQALYLSEKLRNLIQSYKFAIEKTVTCSFGVAQYREEGNINNFITITDTLLYKAKSNGKNRLEIGEYEYEEKKDSKDSSNPKFLR